MDTILLQVGFMLPNRLCLALFLWLLSCACIQIPDLVQGTSPDAGSPYTGPVQLDWLSPASDTTTNGTLQIQVEVSGPAPNRVELLVDGAPVTMLESPYSWKWETWLVSEGTHVLAVRALRNEQVFLSPTRTVTVDRTRPRMIAQSPTTGASAVPVSTPIQATFSEPLDASTVNRQSIQLMTNRGSLEAAVHLSEDGKMLTLSPTSPLPVDQRVRVVVADTVVDFAGNKLESMFGDWEWFVPPYLLLGDPLFAGKIEESSINDSALRMGKDSRPVVAWTQDRSVHAKRWSGDGWEYLGGPLAGSTSYSIWGHDLQIDAEGRPMLAWREYSESAPDQIHVRRWNGAAWDFMNSPMATTLSKGNIRWLGFASGSQGLPIVAWREENSTQAQVVLRQWDGSAWIVKAAPLPLNRNLVVNYMGFDVDGSGRPVFVFRETDSNASEAGRVVQWNGSSWTDIPAGLLGLPTTCFVDGNGNVLVGVTALVDGEWRNLVKKWDGRSWLTMGGPLEKIANGIDGTVESIELDSQGLPVVLASVATSSTDSSIRVGQAQRWTGVQWEPLGGVLMPSPGKATLGRPAFALAADGEPVISWTERIHPATTSMSMVHVYRLNQ
ncbi:Ig-like domain-containing protein [Corallococcus silvisoli]|uniref:Ig-like domain-containing protein n=1 Tax=Corallococcus silvisoli TaxID=2697031 RepID=UPI0013775FA5|nr:Ig-like domain-containing protein [Corallococcus silvisoli]NBD10389.1 hypothetical protein [Corallococcus silvisoli]